MIFYSVLQQRCEAFYSIAIARSHDYSFFDKFKFGVALNMKEDRGHG